MTKVRVGNPSYRTRAIATRVREMRNSRHMSAKDLEKAMERIGISFSSSTIANLENDRRDNITVDELYALAAALNTTIEYLAGGVGHECANCFDEPPLGFACTICGRTT